MKLRKLMTALALAVGFTTAATAAAPVAVWDGDFGTESKTGTDSKTYTLTLNDGNTVNSDGFVVIGSTATKGATISWERGSAAADQKCSVLIKYSSLAHPGATRTIGAIHCTNGSDSWDMGARCEAGSLDLKGYYNGTANYAFSTVPTLTEGSGYCLLALDNSSGGTAAYAGTSEDLMSGGANSGLKFGNRYVDSVSIGGCCADTTFGAWKDVVIEAVAIFPQSFLSASDIADYQFPSERYTGRVVSINIANALNADGGWVDTSSATAISTMAGDIPGTGWQNVGDTTDSGSRRQGSKTGINAWTGSVTETLSGMTFAWNCNDSNMGALYTSVNTSISFLKCYYSRANQSGLALQKMTFTGIPYVKYDVIVYFSGTSATANQSVTFNDVAYYGDTSSSVDYKTVQGNSSSWGAFATPTALTYGGNVLRVDGFESATMEVKVPYSSEKWGIAAIQLVERTTKTYTATVDASKNFSELTWDPAKPSTGFEANATLDIVTTAAATLTLDEDVTVKAIRFKGSAALTLPITDRSIDAAWDFSGTTGGVTIDASSVDGTALAKNAVAGVPYCKWLFKGEVTGTPTVTCPATMPTDYTIASETLANYGIRLVVTAPSVAQFGSININFAGGRSSQATVDGSKVGSLTTAIGGYPVVGTSWNDLGAANQTATSVPKYIKTDGTLVTDASITLTASSVANPYTSGAANNMLITGYMDDGSSPVVTIANIPFAKYRVILYRATDSASTTFSAAQIGTTSSDVKIYYGPTSSDTTGGKTVVGSTEIAWGKSDYRTSYVEGVNYIVSDVLEGTADEATAYIYSHKHAGRAGVAAIQIVEVGEVITSKHYAATVSEAGTADLSDLSWNITPFEPTNKDTVKITVDPSVEGEVVVNVDGANVAASSFTVVSAGNAEIAFTGNAITTEAIDASGVSGRVTFGFATGATSVTAGADTVLANVANPTLTIASGMKLTVNSGALKGSLVSNSGTINLDGGTAEAPITLNGDANFGAITLAENTYVKHGESNPITNRKYLFSGQGATSCVALWRDAGNGSPGMSEGSSFTNLILVSDCNKTTDNVWLERATVAETVGLKMISAICLNGLSPTVRSLTGTGTLRRNAGTETITVKCTEDADFAGDCAVPVVVAASEAVQTFSGTMTGTLTVDEGARVVLKDTANPPSVSGAGTVILAYDGEGELSGDLSGFTGTNMVNACVTVLNLGTARSTAIFNFTGATVVKFTENVVDDGVVPVLTLASGSETPTVKVIGVNGEEKEITGGKYTPTVTGKAAIRAYEFEGNLNNTGSDGSDALGKDNGPFYADGSNSVYALTQPYHNMTWPAEFTVAIHATLPDLENACLIAWGTLDGGGIGLTTGDPTKNEVKMVYWPKNTAYTELAKMNVPNAQKIKHLYVFTKTADTLKIYLDGSLVVNCSGAYTLGGGYQVGSVHGGIGSTGLGRLDQVYATTTDTNKCYAVINSMRIYNAVLGPNAMAELVNEFPYESPNGTFTRALEGDDNEWVSDDAWTKQGEKFDAPSSGSTVNLSAAEESSVTLNLDEPINFEAMNFTGEGSITIAAAADNANKITCSGTATFGADAVVEYSAMSLAGTPISIAPGKTLMIDASMLDLSKYFQNATITLTGLVNADNEADQLKCTLPTEVGGRTVAFAKNESNNTYELTITVPANDFVYAGGTWTWGEQTVDAETVSNNTVQAIVKQGEGELEWPVDRASITVEGGTFKALEVAKTSAGVTVKSGAIFDLNGHRAKEMNLTLAGGRVTNGGDVITEANQIRSITLTADSVVDTPNTNGYEVYASHYNYGTFINLNEYTLTKAGAAQLKLVNHTVKGTGTFYVKEGTVYCGESVTFTNTATLKIGANGTWKQREGSRTTYVSTVVGEGGTLNVLGRISGFNLSGSLTIANAGTYGTITNMTGAVADIGQKRGLTFAGAGKVNVQLTAAEAKKRGVSQTIFNVASGATTTIGTVKDANGNDITSSCLISGGTITVKKRWTVFLVQ